MATEFVCKLRSSGGDYTTMSGWELAGQVNLTLATTKVFSHGGITGTVGDGASVTGQISGATATVVHATTTQILLKTISGTFQSGEEVRVTAGNSVTISNAGDSAISVLECYDDWPSGFSGGVSLGGWTTNSTNYIHIRVADGHEHGGVHQAGFFMVQDTGGVYIDNSHDYTIIEGLDYQQTYLTSGGFGWGSSTNNCVFKRCIGRTRNGSAFGTGYDTTSGVDMYNCVAITTGTGPGFWVRATGSNMVNCLARNTTGTGAHGFRSSYSTPLVYNCVALGFVTNYYTEFSTSSSNNAASDGSSVTPPGTSPITTDIPSSYFTDYANHNYHLVSGASALINAGADRSSFTTEDFDKATRTGTWDVGPDEYVAVGGGGPIVPYLLRRPKLNNLLRM